MRDILIIFCFFVCMLPLSACSDDRREDINFELQEPSCEDSHSPTISVGRTVEAGDYYNLYLNSWDDCCIRKIEISIEKFGRKLYSDDYDFLTCRKRADDVYIPFMKKYLQSNINTTARAIVTDASGNQAEVSCVVYGSQKDIKLDCPS